MNIDSIVKKLILFLLILLPSILWAENVSVDKAKNIAAIWAGGNKSAISTNSTAIKLIWNGEKPGEIAAQSAQQPAFYVFATGEKGFVIVAGEDNVAPIIGYSKENDFNTENMPENVAAWFGQIRNFINSGRVNGAAPTEKTKKQWAAYNTSGIAPTATVIRYLQTPDWNQKYPYNTLCPKDCYTGCVATAMGEILRYIQYPAKGKGTVPEYTTRTDRTKISAHTLGETYDYSKMPMTYSAANPWSTESVNQVSRLIYDCGTMVEMDYTKTGSGAYSSDVAIALTTYMGIDASCTYLRANTFPTSDWIKKLKAQLDEGYPIYYSANDGEGGHAFVADGYNSDDQIHINFGWGGSTNGYYTFPEFGTKSTYIFNLDHDAVFGIKPDAGGSPAQIIGFRKYNASDKGLISSVSTYKLNEQFTITANGFIYNGGNVAFSGEVAVGLVDASDNFIDIVSSSLNISGLSSSYGYTERTFNCKLTEGATGCKLQLFYKPKNGNNWSPVYYDREAFGFAGTLTITIPEPSIDNTSITFDKTNKTMTVTTETGVSVIVKNSSDAEVTTGISKSGNTTTINLSSYAADTYYLVLSTTTKSKTLSFTTGN